MDDKKKITKFKDIKNIMLDDDNKSEKELMDNKSNNNKSQLQNLLFKYIKEIDDFKTRVEKKYYDQNIKDVTFSMKSTYTWLGEGLDITSNHGDKMSIFEENDPIIEYDEIDINNPREEIEIEIYQTETTYDKFKGKIYKDNDGYYINSYQKEGNLIFNSIQELLDFYCDRDEIYIKFNPYGEFKDSERFFEFKIL